MFHTGIGSDWMSTCLISKLYLTIKIVSLKLPHTADFYYSRYLVQHKAVPKQCEYDIAFEFNSYWHILLVIGQIVCYMHVLLRMRIDIHVQHYKWDLIQLKVYWSLHFHFNFNFKTYLKLVFTIVDSKILIHTNYFKKNILNTKEKIISGIFCRCIYHQPSL